MADQEKMPAIVGLRDIATLLKVDPLTPRTWRQRSVLPPEDATISGDTPVWLRSTIVKWAVKTNRWPDKPAAQAAQEPAPVG